MDKVKTVNNINSNTNTTVWLVIEKYNKWTAHIIKLTPYGIEFRTPTFLPWQCLLGTLRVCVFVYVCLGLRLCAFGCACVPILVFHFINIKARHSLGYIMRVVPLGVAEPPHPKALHVQRYPRVHQKPAVVSLRDRAPGVPEQDRRRLLH